MTLSKNTTKGVFFKARAVVTFLARHEVVCIERAVPVSLVGPETVAVQVEIIN